MRVSSKHRKYFNLTLTHALKAVIVHTMYNYARKEKYIRVNIFVLPYLHRKIKHLKDFLIDSEFITIYLFSDR